jgi:hypothetical protein
MKTYVDESFGHKDAAFKIAKFVETLNVIHSDKIKM